MQKNSMAQLNPYITFSGNCRAAFDFYKFCLGGNLTLQTVGESPMADQMPAMQDLIMHVSLATGTLTLMGSDMLGPEGLTAGNNMTLSLNCDSEKEINDYFAKLSVGAKVTHPLKEEFWGGIYGDFTDQFGVRWMLNYQKQPMP